MLGRGIATVTNAIISGVTTLISEKSWEQALIAASTAAISTMITSPVNDWFKGASNTFNSAVTKGAAGFVTGVYVEGTATAGRMVYKSVTSAKPDTAVKSSGGCGRYTNKMMKW